MRWPSVAYLIRAFQARHGPLICQVGGIARATSDPSHPSGSLILQVTELYRLPPSTVFGMTVIGAPVIGDNGKHSGKANLLRKLVGTVFYGGGGRRRNLKSIRARDMFDGIGCTKITKARNEGTMYGNAESRSYLEKKLVFCFGSHIAAQILLPFGEENFLTASELKQAQEIATRMVIQYGWGPDDSPAVYYSTNAVTALSMGNNYEFEIATKVEKIYDLAYEKAKEMLKKNCRALENIVEELLEFEILTGKDLERILNENGGIREKEPFLLSHVDYNEPLSRSFLDEGSASETTFLDVAA